MKVSLLCICGHPVKKHDKANVALPKSILAGCTGDGCRCNASREDFTMAESLHLGQENVFFMQGGWFRNPKPFAVVYPRSMTPVAIARMIKEVPK